MYDYVGFSGSKLPQGSLHRNRGGHQLYIAAATSPVTSRRGSNDPKVGVIQVEGLKKAGNSRNSEFRTQSMGLDLYIFENWI